MNGERCCREFSLRRRENGEVLHDRGEIHSQLEAELLEPHFDLGERGLADPLGL